MKTQPFVITPKDYAPALNVLGIKVTVLAPNKATQGYEITRQRGEKEMGAPPTVTTGTSPSMWWRAKSSSPVQARP